MSFQFVAICIFEIFHIFVFFNFIFLGMICYLDIFFARLMTATKISTRPWFHKIPKLDSVVRVLLQNEFTKTIIINYKTNFTDLSKKYYNTRIFNQIVNDCRVFYFVIFCKLYFDICIVSKI